MGEIAKPRKWGILLTQDETVGEQPEKPRKRAADAKRKNAFQEGKSTKWRQTQKSARARDLLPGNETRTKVPKKRKTRSPLWYNHDTGRRGALLIQCEMERLGKNGLVSADRYKIVLAYVEPVPQARRSRYQRRGPSPQQGNESTSPNSSSHPRHDLSVKQSNVHEVYIHHTNPGKRVTVPVVRESESHASCPS